MKGDFTRSTFQPTRHYSGVRLQQGRVQLDADFNEMVDIGGHRDETSTYDLVGPVGAPYHDAGFAVQPLAGDLEVGDGRIYVDGILCENEQAVQFTEQPDVPGAALPTEAGVYLAYLDVWRRHLTAAERPELREVALGGPDTATRTRTTWQVKLARVGNVGAETDCTQFGPDWAPPESQSTGRLRARAAPAPETTNECLVPPGGGFRRLENHLYRVEVHESGGPGTARFKWSRDNGSVVVRLENVQEAPARPNEAVLTLSEPGRDLALGFAAGQWVELSDEARTLNDGRGILVEVASAQGRTLNVTGWPGGVDRSMASFGEHPTVRRWEDVETVVIATGSEPRWLELEDGVQVEFADGRYQIGDYWTIPARTLTGAVEWPREGGQAVFEPRQGIEHHYGSLALLQLDGGAWTLLSDCRPLFPPLTELLSFCYVGGDGQETMPDLTQPDQLTALEEPLQVGVANGRWPVDGARVRFTVTGGDGRLKDSAAPADPFDQQSVEVETVDGIASCRWALHPGTQSQTVEALLLDAGDQPVHLPIRFTANLSVASQVAYDPGTCEGLQDTRTVQEAIDRVSRLARLFYLGGDGQEAMPDPAQPDAPIPLPRPLRVIVANDCGPIAGAAVQFEVTLGKGQVKPAGSPEGEFTGDPIKVATDADGIAGCDWALSADPRTPGQVVEVTLLDAAGMPLQAPIRLQMTAHLRLASQVYYDPENCGGLKDFTTVQDAIDQLCKASGEPEPGFHIRELRLGTDQLLRNDTAVRVNDVVSGILIDCDREVDSFSISHATLFLSLEMPYPFNDADRELWGDVPQPLGFQPLVLTSEVGVEGSRVLWRPAPATASWLQQQLFQMLAERKLGDRLLARLTLKGNFIWSSTDPPLQLDGDVFGFRRPDGQNTDLDFRNNGSGDGRKGGDFSMWFWLVQLVRLRSVTLSRADIVGGTTVDPPLRGIVTLTGLATDEGAAVKLTSSQSNAVQVPEVVELRAGTFEQDFPITTQPVAESVPVTITASFGDVTRSAVLTVRAPSLNTCGLQNSNVTGGTSVQGTVTLNGPAPTGGSRVTLSSNNAAVQVPSTGVLVRAGQTSATFTITTSAVTSQVAGTITASFGNVNRTATLTVRPPALDRVTAPGGVITGGTPVQGTVVLDGPAPTGGSLVTLSSSNPEVVSVPANVRVSAGQTSASFPIGTTGVIVIEVPRGTPLGSTTRNFDVDIAASFAGVQRQTTMTVRVQIRRVVEQDGGGIIR